MISTIRIERFKCFEDVVIDFGKISLLAGSNGAGKSTVIQSILLLRQAYLSGNLEGDRLQLNGDLINIGTAKDALFGGSQEDSISFTIYFSQYSDEEYRYEFYYDKENPYQHFMNRVLHNLPLHLSKRIKTIEPLFTPSVGPFAPRFSYLMAERLGPRLTYPMSSLPDNEAHVGIQGEFTAYCLAKFGNDPIINKGMALKNDEEKMNITLSQQTQLWMRQIMPGLAFNVEPITKADMVRLELKIYGERTDYLRPTNMGFGISYSLPIVVAGLMAEPGTMLIVENPEAHLHPSAQSNIAQFLSRVANNNVQVIIETHSDHVLNGLRLAVKNKIIDDEHVNLLYFLHNEKLGRNTVEKPEIAKDGGIDHWPEGFFDQFEKDLRGLF